MLDKLIESKNQTRENKRLGKFLLTTSTGALSVLIFALIYSLFSYNLALGSDNINLTTLIAPIPAAEKEQPIEPQAAPQKQQKSVEQTISKLPTRRENIQRVDEESIVAPKEISVSANQQMARPNNRFLVSSVDTDPSGSGIGTGMRGGSPNGTGIANTLEQKPEIVKTEIETPPAVKIKPKEETVAAVKKAVTISSGVVNGKASNLVTPVYSPAARAVHAGGEVKVQVTIDEDGRVISASAMSGHPLLTPSALTAARQSKFTPTFLSGQKVKVTGIIVYNFKV